MREEAWHLGEVEVSSRELLAQLPEQALEATGADDLEDPAGLVAGVPADLFAGCSAHFMAEHPFPDLTGPLAVSDPERRVRETLAPIYAWFRQTEAMTAHIQRDRLLIPALDEFTSGLMDPVLEWIEGELGSGFGASGARAERIAAMVAVATDFWTWRRLKQVGLDDGAAARLMAAAVARA